MNKIPGEIPANCSLIEWMLLLKAIFIIVNAYIMSGVRMKHIITFLSILLLPLIGCSDYTEFPVEPTSNNKVLEKQSVLSETPDCRTPKYELIPLPPRAPEWQGITLSANAIIFGKLGGEIVLDKFYIADDGRIINILASLKIPPGAFKGARKITIKVDDEFAALHFYPSMTFEKPLMLTQSFTGLNLSDYRTGTIDFSFIGDDGSVECIRKNAVQVIVPQGFVRVLNARLSHFSRYGWTRGPQLLEPKFLKIK